MMLVCVCVCVCVCFFVFVKYYERWVSCKKRKDYFGLGFGAGMEWFLCQFSLCCSNGGFWEFAWQRKDNPTPPKKIVSKIFSF